MSRTLGSVIRSTLVTRQEATAIIDPGHSRWNYNDLLGYVDKYKKLLKGLSWIEGDSLGLLVPKRAQTIALMIAALEEGIPFVPCDPEAPRERALKIFESSASRYIVTGKETTDQFRSESEDIGYVADVEGSDFSIIERKTDPRGPEKHPETAYILYTSGSTGDPKGVQITSENALAFIEWATEALVPGVGRVFTSIAPLHFDLSVFDIYVSLITGGSVVLFDGKTIKNPRMMAKVMSDEKVNIVYSTPTILKLLLKYGKIERYDWTSLEVILFAGEVFQVDSLRSLKKVWKRPLWYNLYGPTETNVVTWYKLPEIIDVDRTKPFPIGLTCPYAEYILRDEEGVLSKSGTGELLISGRSVMPGYVGGKEGVMIDHDGILWYPTGDWVATDESGLLVFQGRQDGMVKRNGYRIELGEIERAYVGIGGHEEVIAFSLTDGEQTYIALAIRSTEEPSAMVELKEIGSKHLPMYMLPDFFIYIDEVPMTSSQKIDYQELKNIVRDRFFS